MPDEKDEKRKAIELAMTQIDRQYGKGSIMWLGEDRKETMAVIPTGSISLDAALGVGGVPRGRVIEIFGPESSGKTTLALHIIAEAQKTGGLAAFIDAEHALDANYAKLLGVDTDNLLISQPDTGEQALEIAEALVNRRWRSPRPWCAAVLWMWWSSIRWRLWYREPRSKAKWAMPRWDCRRD